MYEMYDMFAPCPFVSCTFLVCHAAVPWEPGIRDHPTILHDSLTSHFLLHRYLHELPGPECCRGTISVSPPWHLFPSAMATNASYHAHVNIFIKLHKTCICHPHHDNNI